jgi:hypothetical protein
MRWAAMKRARYEIDSAAITALIFWFKFLLVGDQKRIERALKPPGRRGV